MRRMLVAVLGAVALVAVGCADQDGSLSSGDSSDELTKAEYIAKADDICREVEAGRKPYKAELDALPGDAKPKDGAPVIAGGLAETRKGQERLRALPVPSEDRGDHDAYVAAVDRAIVTGEQIVRAARANDRSKAEGIAADNAGLAAEQQRLARKYGFKVCGASGG